MLDLFQLTAEKIHHVPAGWRWCIIDAHNKPPGFIEVQGGVPTEFYKSGPRKGFPKWTGVTLNTLWMEDAAMDAVAKQWEVENDKCHKCEGSGKTIKSSHVVHGNTYRECKRCEGSGKPTGKS